MNFFKQQTQFISIQISPYYDDALDELQIVLNSESLIAGIFWLKVCANYNAGEISPIHIVHHIECHL